jgi:hypothetical protein
MWVISLLRMFILGRLPRPVRIEQADMLNQMHALCELCTTDAYMYLDHLPAPASPAQSPSPYIMPRRRPVVKSTFRDLAHAHSRRLCPSSILPFHYSTLFPEGQQLFPAIALPLFPSCTPHAHLMLLSSRHLATIGPSALTPVSGPAAPVLVCLCVCV